MRMIACPSSRRRTISSSTRAVSWTPRAAVGSSMMMSLEANPAARQIETACRWPPERRRTREPTAGTLTARVETISSALVRIARRLRNATGPNLRTSSRLRNRFCHTVRSSTSARFWCTVSIPASLASCGDRKFTVSPSKEIAPESGECTPLTQRISVDLPAPLSPTMAVTSPRRACIVTFLRART